MVLHLGLLTLVYVAAAAQVVVAPRVAVGGVRPEFLLLAAWLAVGAVRGWPGLVWAAAAGLIGDCLSDRPPGSGMLATTLVMLFVQRRMLVRPPASAFGAAGVCGTAIAVTVVAREAISAVVARHVLDAAGLLAEAALVAAYSSCLVLAVHVAWRWLATLSPIPLCRSHAQPARQRLP